ncbi:hypothetical protein WR25_23082 [Diploscapter pachys]|uniref:Uncharacterized protein n=1 Tax=Diploscapter pachys TaxID=2018661 RepID=A0A2A2JY35_9BILA|nr:hypothetical protein WR25_23082 [Diploscapter pachys]
MLLDDIGGGLAPRRHREADRAVFRLDFDHQSAQHIDAEALPRLAIFGIAAHRRGDVIVDPVARALIVIIGPRPARDKGADMLDLRQRHGKPLCPVYFLTLWDRILASETPGVNRLFG